MEETPLSRLRRVKTYTLRHLAYHLFQSDQHERLYHLLVHSDAWMRAKYERFTNDTSYLDDLNLALQNLSDPFPDDTKIIHLIELWTARVVVHQRNRTFSDTDIATLVWLGRTNEALNYVRLRANNQDIFRGLWVTYKSLKNKSNRDIKLLEELEQVAVQIGEAEARSAALADIATEYLEMEEFDRVEQLLPYIQSGTWQFTSQISMAYIQFKRGRFEKAQALLSQVESQVNEMADDGSRSAILTTLASAWHEMGGSDQSHQLFQRALIVARQSDDPQTKIFAMCVLGRSLVEANNHVDAREVYEEARRLVENIEIVGMRDFTRTMLIDEIIKAGMYDLYPAIVHDMLSDTERMAAQCAVAGALAISGTIDQANHLISMVRDKLDTLEQDDQAYIYGKLAQVFADMDDWSIVQNMQSNIQDQKRLRKTLVDLALKAASTGHLQKAGDLYEQYRALPVEYPVTAPYIHALCTIATALHQWGYATLGQNMLERAVEAIQQVDNTTHRANALHQIVITTLRIHQMARVWQLVEELPQERDHILLTLATQLDQGNQLKLLPMINQQLSYKEGSSRAELLRLWSVALARRNEFIQAQELIDQLIQMNRRLMSAITSAIGSTEKSPNLDLLFNRWLCLQAESLCEVAVAQLSHGDQANAEMKLRHLESQISETEDIYLKIAPSIILALTRYRIGQPRKAVELITRAQHWAESILNRERKENALYEIVQYYLKTDQLDRAYQLADTMDKMGTQRQRSLTSIVEKVAHHGDMEAAMQIIVQINDPELRIEASQYVAGALWQRRHIVKALELYASAPLDEFINQITKLLCQYAHQRQDEEQLLYRQTLLRMIQITAWVDANWDRIYQTLARPLITNQNL